MQSNRFFVEYTEYSGFGQLTVSREFFAEWIQLQRFMRQLKQSAVLDYGETQSQASQKVAA